MQQFKCHGYDGNTCTVFSHVHVLAHAIRLARVPSRVIKSYKFIVYLMHICSHFLSMNRTFLVTALNYSSCHILLNALMAKISFT